MSYIGDDRQKRPAQGLPPAASREGASWFELEEHMTGEEVGLSGLNGSIAAGSDVVHGSGRSCILHVLPLVAAVLLAA